MSNDKDEFAEKFAGGLSAGLGFWGALIVWPGLISFLAKALKLSELFREAGVHVEQDFLGEALNSGDGVYRP
jgi:hypothetical protein